MNKSSAKLIVAVICLAAAGVLISWQMGLFASGGSRSTATPQPTADTATGTAPTDGAAAAARGRPVSRSN